MQEGHIPSRRPNPPKKVDIHGVLVDCVSMDEAIAEIEAMIASGEPHFVATADTAGIAQAQGDPDLMGIYKRADLVTPDSFGVVWAIGRRGIKLDRVTGVELVARICQLSADKGCSIFILGAEPGVAELAADKLRLAHPGCNIVGTRHGYFPASDDEVVAEEVARMNPDVLFVAMGIPRQEKFILATQHIIKARVAMGVGGSFDVYSGKARRAPRWVQALRLEWLWRTLLNPKKFSKAVNLPKFVMRELRGPK